MRQRRREREGGKREEGERRKGRERREMVGIVWDNFYFCMVAISV